MTSFKLQSRLSRTLSEQTFATRAAAKQFARQQYGAKWFRYFQLTEVTS